jgi:hypothetical protein
MAIVISIIRLTVKNSFLEDLNFISTPLTPLVYACKQFKITLHATVTRYNQGFFAIFLQFRLKSDSLITVLILGGFIMSFCANCGTKMTDGDLFCSQCGHRVAPVAPAAPVEPVEPVAPVTPQPAPNTGSYYISEEQLIAEEQDFLDTTHRILRWEQKAWSIYSKFSIIAGAILTGLSFILMIVSAAEGDDEAAFAAGMLFGYCFFFVSMLVIGIIGSKVAGKMPQYLNTVYSDFSITNNRCGNVGMLIFCIFFGEVSFVFFLINFIRLKSNSKIIERILARQGK